jgi:hypothetical protein
MADDRTRAAADVESVEIRQVIFQPGVAASPRGYPVIIDEIARRNYSRASFASGMGRRQAAFSIPWRVALFVLNINECRHFAASPFSSTPGNCSSRSRFLRLVRTKYELRFHKPSLVILLTSAKIEERLINRIPLLDPGRVTVHVLRRGSQL